MGKRQQAVERRKLFCERHRYGETAAGKEVRKYAFCEIDYDPMHPDRRCEFDTFDKAFEFDEAPRLDGSGDRRRRKRVKPSDEPAAQRRNVLKRLGRYGENAAGKWVRKSAFREIDCDRDNPDSLREFDSFEKAFEFDEARRLDGTGGRHARYYPKP